MVGILEASVCSTLTFLHACVRCPVELQLLQTFLAAVGETTFSFFLVHS